MFSSDFLNKDFNLSITSKILPNKDTIVTIDPVKDFEKEEVDRIRTKISLILQNFKHPKDNLSKDERRALKELQSDTVYVIDENNSAKNSTMFFKLYQKCFH